MNGIAYCRDGRVLLPYREEMAKYFPGKNLLIAGDDS